MNMIEKTMLQLIRKLDLDRRISELVIDAVREEVPRAVEIAVKDAVTATIHKELPGILEDQLGKQVKECVEECLPGILKQAVREVLEQGADTAYREVLFKETEKLRQSLVEALYKALVQVTEGNPDLP